MKKIKLCLLAVFVMVLFLTSISVSAYGFGVKKNSLHQQPEVGFYGKIITDNGGYYVGDKEEKYIYLTFDCGYENGYTAQILDVLAKKNVKATFFVTGHYVDSSGDLVLRMYQEGHTVGNHSNKHLNITKTSYDTLAQDLNRLNDKYQKLTGANLAPFFRPPAGEFDDRSLKMVASLGYTSLFWSIAYADWNRNAPVSSVVKEIEGNIHNGAIILLHAVSSSNALALEPIITDLESQGYQFALPERLIIHAE